MLSPDLGDSDEEPELPRPPRLRQIFGDSSDEEEPELPRPPPRRWASVKVKPHSLAGAEARRVKAIATKKYKPQRKITEIYYPNEGPSQKTRIRDLNAFLRLRIFPFFERPKTSPRSRYIRSKRQEFFNSHMGFTRFSSLWEIHRDFLIESHDPDDDLAFIRKNFRYIEMSDFDLVNRPLVDIFKIENPSSRGVMNSLLANYPTSPHYQGDAILPEDDAPSPDVLPKKKGRFDDWLTLTNTHFYDPLNRDRSARDIPIPRIHSYKFIRAEDLVTLEPFETGDLIVEIRCGDKKNYTYMLRDSFNQWIDLTQGAMNHPLGGPLAGCSVRQFRQP